MRLVPRCTPQVYRRSPQSASLIPVLPETSPRYIQAGEQSRTYSLEIPKELQGSSCLDRLEYGTHEEDRPFVEGGQERRRRDEEAQGERGKALRNDVGRSSLTCFVIVGTEEPQHQANEFQGVQPAGDRGQVCEQDM
jgi:hypothetical protein